MTRSQDLKQQLATLEARRKALAADLEEAKLACDAAREAVLTGEKSATKTATEKQAAYMVLDAALSDLDQRIEGLRDEIKVETAAEERAAHLAQLASLAREAEAEAAEHMAALEEASAVLTPCIERMLRSHDRRVAIRGEFIQAAGLGSKDVDAVRRARALLEEVERTQDVSLDEILYPIYGSTATQLDRVKQGTERAVVPYGAQIVALLSTILMQREQERYSAEKLARAQAYRKREEERVAAGKAREAETREAYRREQEEQAAREQEEREKAKAYWASIYNAT